MDEAGLAPLRQSGTAGAEIKSFKSLMLSNQQRCIAKAVGLFGGLTPHFATRNKVFHIQF
jgi:hypothetical protein